MKSQILRHYMLFTHNVVEDIRTVIFIFVQVRLLNVKTLVYNSVDVVVFKRFVCRFSFAPAGKLF